MRSALHVLAALALALALHAAATRALAAAAPPRADGVEVTSNDGTYVVRYAFEGGAPEVRTPLALLVEVRRADGAPADVALEVDARMPEHGHGMNREPVIAREGPGRFRAENLYLHMTGRWELYLDVRAGAVTERAQDALVLE